MAYDSFYKFADNVKKDCLRQREYAKYYASIGPQNLDETQKRAYWNASAADHIFADVLFHFYEALHAIPKLKSQKWYVREILFELFPAQSKGYFKSDK